MRHTCLAFDLGAESGRAFIGRFDGSRLGLSEIRRFPNTPVLEGSTLRWDMNALWRDVTTVLRESASDAVTSLGVDAWGCDYALLDSTGALLEAPYHYRDRRTDGVMADVLSHIAPQRIYATTGVQFLPFNTLYQLCATPRALLDRASVLLTIPDLLNYWLTGRACCEYTNATTTQCVDAGTRTWAMSLVDELALPRHIFPPIVEPGTLLGPVQPSVGHAEGVPVIAPACHDTGSAVAAIDASSGTAYLSSGTWSLMGVERPGPTVTERGLALNMTNEGGVLGTTRLLKNIAGLWLLQACRRDWGGQTAEVPSYGALTDMAAASDTRLLSLVDPDHPDFLHPSHMPEAIAAYCVRTGQPAPASFGAFARAIFESLALKYRCVLEWLEEITGTPISVVRVIGGGSRNAVLNQWTADATGRTVLAGPVEAAALGNIAMQLVATGALPSLASARRLIDECFPPQPFYPAGSGVWEPAYRRFREYMEPARA